MFTLRLLSTQCCCRGAAGRMLAPTCGDLGTATSTRFQQQPSVHPAAPQTVPSAPGQAMGPRLRSLPALTPLAA